jgi:hypothetical protein
MQIKFVRSGGLAAMPGLNVEGRLATVSSEAVKYRRDLTGPEAEQLRTAADPVAISRAKSALASRPSAARDAYQYEITIATEDGKTHKVTLNAAGGQELSQMAPGLGQLVQWIDQESQRIKAHRLGGR